MHLLKKLFVNDLQPDEPDNSFVYKAADGLLFVSDHFMNHDACCRLGALVRPIPYYTTAFYRLGVPWPLQPPIPMPFILIC